MAKKAPSYRLHKPTGQAVVTINGRDKYLGKHDSSESRGLYHRLIDEWEGNGRRSPAVGGVGSDMTISELIVAYLKQADSYYLKNGEPTTEPVNLGFALKPVRQLDSSHPEIKASSSWGYAGNGAFLGQNRLERP